MFQSKRRAGVSLMEVLFSIGVVAVGLTGVIAIYPIALDHIGRGNTADRAAQFGLNAEEEFYARGLRNPANWLAPRRPAASLRLMHEGDPVNPFASPTQSYCIDPQFVAANLGTAVATGNPYNPDMFPYVVPTAANFTTEPRMQRISVRGQLSRTVSGTQIFAVIRRPIADAMCQLDDELSFDIPQEKSLPPAQQYMAGAMRTSEGNFSWMATLVPLYDPTPTASGRDSYNLAFVVFHKRDPSMAMFIDANGNGLPDPGESTFNESVATITDVNFHGLGIRGGDVTMQASSYEALNVKVGDWVMLSRRLPLAAPGVTPPNSQGYFRWYRVVGAEMESRAISATEFERDVTLEGQDWPVNTTMNPAPAPTQVTIVKNVVNVYERTIRIGQ